jgi:hypothetical protein
VHSITTVVYDGKNAPKRTAETTVSGVDVLGLAAKIDPKGIHIASTSNKQVLDILNEQLNFLLGVNGFKVQAVGSSLTGGDHAYGAQAGGLLMTYDNTVSGVPQSPTIPPIPFCKEILAGPIGGALDPILSQVPADLCTPPAPPNVNGHYFGTAQIGAAGTVVSAADFDFVGTSGGAFPTTYTPGTNPTTTFVPGTPGTPGTAGTPGLDPGTTGTPQNPSVAAPGAFGNAGFVEDLGDAAKRLKYLFPALLLSIIGILAGRLTPAPPRLPGANS